MLDQIEAFCKMHEHTIGALEAVSTLCAVLVSLVLAHRATVADRTRLLAKLQISTLMHPSLSLPYPRYVVVTVTNIGNLPLKVSLGFFCWRVPFIRRKWVMLPVNSEGFLGVQPKTYPVTIEPRSSDTFYISEASKFLKAVSGIKTEQNWISGRLFFLKKATVLSTDGHTFRAKGDRTITAAVLRELRS